MVDKHVFAVWTVTVGALLGVVGNLFFYDHPVGLTLPLFALLVSGAVLGTLAVMRRRPRLRNLWPLLPLLFFAAMGAVRADPIILFLDLMAIFGLGALVLHYLPLAHAIDEDSAGDYTQATGAAAIHVGGLPAVQGVRAAAWLRDQRPLHRPNVGAVARGLLFTIPLLLVFAVLLSSADEVFAGYMTRALGLLKFPNLGGAIPQLVLIGFLGWLGCGAVAYGARTLAPTPDNADVQPAKKRPYILGVVEAMMMLGAVDLLFAAFVAIQFRYFFGGQQNVAVEGLTYAQYARRGFFELVAVSVLTLGLGLWLDWVTVRHSPRQTTVFRALAVVLVALTGVMLVSAAQRMSLYEQSYGFTHLRLYTHVFMGWLAVLFVFFLLALFRVRDRIFSLGTLVVIVGYLVTLNLLNTEQLIAGANVARYLTAGDKATVDTCYLTTLSVDALPAMVTLYHESSEPTVHNRVGSWLRLQLYRLDATADRENALTFNLSRANARAQLEPLRQELETQRFVSSDSSCSYFNW